ncbi:hypothetical protein DERP_000637 [Dermatophagoides pteronyssinus]|uniref:Uncharacterized protein n=1 Tax=Dermatophagoides pteronyssinus TaxID=6956 RepID=A0ABQ8J0W3_DERPT|nr:hypothetical protein DERP_000637 [Dermatophagoides pteronyssinus]
MVKILSNNSLQNFNARKFIKAHVCHALYHCRSRCVAFLYDSSIDVDFNAYARQPYAACGTSCSFIVSSNNVTNSFFCAEFNSFQHDQNAGLNNSRATLLHDCAIGKQERNESDESRFCSIGVEPGNDCISNNFNIGVIIKCI